MMEIEELERVANPNKMPRNSAILYLKTGGGQPNFAGMLKLDTGQEFWVSAWVKRVKDMVLELRFESR